MKFENIISINEEYDEKIPLFFPIDEANWKIYLKNKKGRCKIILFATHTLVDGRTIFDLLELFCCLATKEKIPEFLIKTKNQPAVLPYKRKDCFEDDPIQDKDLKNIPSSWEKSSSFAIESSG